MISVFNFAEFIQLKASNNLCSLISTTALLVN